jgi:hypothetical protein
VRLAGRGLAGRGGEPIVRNAILLQSDFDKWEEKYTRKDPAYRIIPLSVAHSDRETSRNARKISRL